MSVRNFDTAAKTLRVGRGRASSEARRGTSSGTGTTHMRRAPAVVLWYLPVQKITVWTATTIQLPSLQRQFVHVLRTVVLLS